ncbi:ParA family protein [Pseudobutyrivibrio xylanivorans]|uniref:MinD/ParA family protein n=1 Tax=Pseudobutyrivibrio xylanivorans TaxID=185007 RepID=A0A5P6VM12_PSEXY|nr:AAA family ATPase [Pseudobutyrivibrio xylanivorans]QFJ53398.1 MinD/ParA family protein [Pseudobutyrivibrio xylanivorans]QFJ53475.1 MinD/ParA family protein [Pseudobutyrivibrio xylanivorans]
MRVVLIGNILGGQGKSVIAHNFAALLNKKGFRTLMIDGDGLASLDCYIDDDNKSTIKDVIYEKKTIVETIQRGEYFDYVRGSSNCRVDGIDTAKVILLLQKQFETINLFYDYGVIDLPAGNLVKNRLFATVADELIIPVTNYLHESCIHDYIDEMLEMKQFNEKFAIRGILLNRIDERHNDVNLLYKRVYEKLNPDKINRIFSTTLRESYLMPYSIYEKKFICEYERYVGIRQDFENFVDEYLAG